jgi:hypothetical protein
LCAGIHGQAAKEYQGGQAELFSGVEKHSNDG